MEEFLYLMHLKRNILTLLTGTAGSQLVVVLMMPILTRHYDSAAFGNWALFVAVGSMLGLVSGLRFDASILLPTRQIDALRLYKTAIFSTAAISLVSALVLIFLTLGGYIESSAYMGVPLSVLMMGLYQANVAWANRNRKYRQIAIAGIAQSTITATANMAFLMMPFNSRGAEELIIATLIGQATGAAMLALHEWKMWPKKFHFFWRLRLRRRLIYSYRDFPLYSVPEALLGSVSSSLHLYAVNHFFTIDIAGQVALAWRVLLLPTSLIGGAASIVFTQKFSTEVARGHPIAQMMIKIWSGGLLLGLIPAMLMFVFGGDLFMFVFGSKWMQAGEISEKLSLFIYLLFAFSLVSGSHMVLRLQHASLFFSVFSLLLKIFLATNFHGRVEFMLMGFLCVDLMCSLLMNMLAMRNSSRVVA